MELTENEAIFLTRFMGKCWHEWKAVRGEDMWDCEKCHTYTVSEVYPKIVPTFSEVQAYMEEKLPGLWEEYLKKCFYEVSPRLYKFFIPLPEAFRKAQDLHNLATFLLENVDRWGYERVYGKGNIELKPVSALVYARESGMIKEEKRHTWLEKEQDRRD